MFPLLINYDTNNKWYEMEKVNGIPISRLFLSEELSTEQLDHIIGSIKRIHSCKNNDNINIYLNYSTKLKNRYNIEYYSQFKNSEKIYNELLRYFEDYENKNNGKKTVIHGDPVLTNILINQFGKIKLIDMRGKLDDKLTISGDSLYDWAKIYQSLIGYDEILEETEINNNYKKLLISHFEKKYMEINNKNDLTDLKMATKLLLFTLLPLHNNEKCIKYYNLIYSL
jgi:aminoglycoside phosphotransferase (APT) family kinase protein